MHKRTGCHLPKLGRTAAAALGTVVSLVTGCQSVPVASEPLDAETVGMEARALCESANLRVKSMKIRSTDGVFTHIGLKCIGGAMSVSWTKYASSIDDFCNAAGQHLSVRELKIEREDGKDPSTEVEVECR